MEIDEKITGQIVTTNKKRLMIESKLREYLDCQSRLDEISNVRPVYNKILKMMTDEFDSLDQSDSDKLATLLIYYLNQYSR